MRDSERLSRDTAAELRDLTHDHIRTPVLRDREQVGDHLLRIQTRKQLANTKQGASGTVQRKSFELRLQTRVALVRRVTLPVKPR